MTHRSLFLTLALAACGDSATAFSPAPPADGGTEAGAEGGTSPTVDGGGGPAPSEFWIKPFSAQALGIRVAAHPKGGVVVYGNRTGADVGAFATAFDRFGTKGWDARLGVGHVAQVTAAKDGFLVTGHRTTDFARGAAGAFIARVSEEGAVGFQTEWPFSYARSLGIGTDASGAITAVGMVEQSATHGFDVTLAQFTAAGASSSSKVLPHENFKDEVLDAVIDPDGNAYIVSTSQLDSLSKVSPSGQTLWSVVTAGRRVRLDPTGNVRYLTTGDQFLTYSPTGTKLGEIPWRLNANEVGWDFVVGPHGQILVAGTLVRKKDSAGRIEVAQALVLVFDAAGQRIAKATLGGSGVREARSIAVDRDGALLLAGSFTGDISLTDGGPSLASGSGTHFVARMPIPTTL